MLSAHIFSKKISEGRIWQGQAQARHLASLCIYLVLLKIRQKIQIIIDDFAGKGQIYDKK